MSKKRTRDLRRDRVTLHPDLPPVSRACLGMCKSHKAVAAAFEAGINFFFLSSDLHWPLYEHLRRGLAMLVRDRPSRRDEIVVVGTSYVTSPELVTAPFSEILSHVPGLERIDVLAMGGSYATDFMPRLLKFIEHKGAGRFGARAIAATFHDRMLAGRALDRRFVDLGFIRYNARHPGAQEEIFPFLHHVDRPPVFSFKSMDGHVTLAEKRAAGVSDDHWTPEPTDAYRFVLSRPEIDGVLCTLNKESEVKKFVAAYEAGPLTGEELEYMQNLAALVSGRATFRTKAP